MVDFFARLQQEYVTEPDGVAPRGVKSLSAKTVNNIHANLSALWHWALDEGWSHLLPVSDFHPSFETTIIYLLMRKCV
jgi:hypothetical protein